MSREQALRRAEKLTQTTGRQHVVVEERFTRHEPSFWVMDALAWWYREGSEGWLTCRMIWPEPAP